MNTTTRNRVKDAYVGRTEDGEKFYVSIELRTKDGQTWETTEHGSVDSFTELSISGVTIRKGGSFQRDGDWRGCGQNVDDLRSVLYGGKLDGPLDNADVLFLLDAWDRWHLNGMIAGCAHMKAAPTGTRGFGFTIGALDSPDPVKRWDGSMSEPTLSHYTVNRALVCPETGYLYGRSWLVEEIPTETLNRLRTIMEKFA